MQLRTHQRGTRGSRILAAAAVITAGAIALSGCSGGAAKPQTSGPLKIGISLSLTGEFSDWATNCPEYKVTAVQISPSNGPS